MKDTSKKGVFMDLPTLREAMSKATVHLGVDVREIQTSSENDLLDALAQAAGMVATDNLTHGHTIRSNEENLISAALKLCENYGKPGSLAEARGNYTKEYHAASAKR